jgi:hypothetical protein
VKVNMQGGEGITFSALLGYITWYIKGLFTLKKIVARDLTRYILFQVYIIMAKFDSGKGLPCVWCLLPNKSEDAYQLMWDAILKKLNMDGTTHQPERVVIDFEAAVIKTLRNRIPGVPVVSCSFHFQNAKAAGPGTHPFSSTRIRISRSGSE